ncbi:hypothetical protein RchiOBHm_Chr2g0111761 [Rosa chinensis]|uniref:Uncharacterized protein n=1 Tax=Rosa chinensis TaxID=74649 RepID=A0A2P6RQ28_ROSCH|nr:hypothetical protein RchiOBHm_Chr2g0111761 [Rosa chinensis]
MAGNGEILTKGVRLSPFSLIDIAAGQRNFPTSVGIEDGLEVDFATVVDEDSRAWVVAGIRFLLGSGLGRQSLVVFMDRGSRKAAGDLVFLVAAPSTVTVVAAPIVVGQWCISTTTGKGMGDGPIGLALAKMQRCFSVRRRYRSGRVAGRWDAAAAIGVDGRCFAAAARDGGGGYAGITHWDALDRSSNPRVWAPGFGLFGLRFLWVWADPMHWGCRFRVSWALNTCCFVFSDDGVEGDFSSSSSSTL